MLMTVNNRGSGLSTCLFNNDVAVAKSHSLKKDRNPSTRSRSTPVSKIYMHMRFVRGSKVEAARVPEDAKNHYESGGCSNGDGFSARHLS